MISTFYICYKHIKNIFLHLKNIMTNCFDYFETTASQMESNASPWDSQQWCHPGVCGHKKWSFTHVLREEKEGTMRYFLQNAV